MSCIFCFSLYWIYGITRQFDIYSLCVSCVTCMHFSNIAEFGFFTFTLDAVRRLMPEASDKDIKKGISDSLKYMSGKKGGSRYRVSTLT